MAAHGAWRPPRRDTRRTRLLFSARHPRHPRRPRRRWLARASPPRADRARRSSRVSSSSSRRHRISAARSYRATRTSPWSARSRDTTPPRPRRACAPCPTTSKSTIGVATARAWWFPKKIQSGPEHPPSRTSVSAPPSRSIARSRSGSESPSSSRTDPRRLAKKSPPSWSPPRYPAPTDIGDSTCASRTPPRTTPRERRTRTRVCEFASSRRHDDRGAREGTRASRAARSASSPGNGIRIIASRRRATTAYLNAATRAATIANRALTCDPLDTVVRC